MSDLKMKYASTGAGITITLNNLASSATAGRESTVIDNSTNLYDWIIIHAKITSIAAAAGSIYFWAYEVTLDDTGSPVDLYPGVGSSSNITGSDAAVTTVPEKDLNYLGAIDVGASEVHRKQFDLSTAFGGRIPRKWGIVVRNISGQALGNTAGDNEIHYFGGWYQVV